jgi:hypothetical protein
MKKKYTMSERALGRRVFLKALGIGIAAPLALKMSGMAMAEPGGAPVRLFIFYVPHGWPTESVEPLGSGADFLKGSSVLSSLAPYNSYVNVVRGISNKVVNNHAAIRSVLTGAKEGDGADSIDYLIAQKLGTKAHALGAIPYDKGAGFHQDCFLVKHGSWVRPEEDPSKAAAELLGAVGPVDPGKPDESVFRNQALALTESQIERMSGALKDITSEQSKLQVHLDAVRSLKTDGGGSSPGKIGCDSAPALPAVDAVKGSDMLSHGNMAKIVDAHLEVAANALLCGSARVITMQNMWVNNTVNFGFAGGPGIAKAHHDPASHSWDKNGRNEFAKMQGWFYERLATKLISKLNQPDPLDPKNTVLHNTLIYCCSEISDGANHNSDYTDVWLDGKPVRSILPAVLIGRAGGYIGQKGVVTAERSHLDMLATIASAMGAPLSTIAGQGVQPIKEVQA